MQIFAKTVDEYIAHLSQEDQTILQAMRASVLKALPKGYEESIQYGMIAYVVPLSAYPQGYLKDPTRPLPYLSIARQKNHFAFYSMGLFAMKERFVTLKEDYQKTYGKLDHGTSCLRFRNPQKISYPLIEAISAGISMQDYIDFYQKVKG